MSAIKKVAVFGASGNFGTPITAALGQAGFEVTIITRPESTSTFPNGITVIRSEYTVEKLKTALAGQDAVVCAVGPAGVGSQVAMIDAAEAAGVRRFIVNDFGWGPNSRTLEEFRAIGLKRQASWNRAATLADANQSFTWTGITSGNPIDWALPRFPLMGFDISRSSAIMYDDGTEEFTGTTLEGIGQSVVGILQNPNETANRFVKVRSIQVCQVDLLSAFQIVTGRAWDVELRSSEDLLRSGRRKFKDGTSGWVLELVVAQLYDKGEGRCLVASRADSDAELLGIKEETAIEVVTKALRPATSLDVEAPSFR